MIISLLAAFVLELVLQNFVGVNVIGLLALDPANLGPATPIQMLSYALIERPQSAGNMLIGLVFMWLIMSPFESSFGPRKTLQLAVSGVLGAALATIVAAHALPVDSYLYLGSQPIAYAGMSAMASVMRRGRILFFGLFPMTSTQLLLVLVGFAALDFLASKDYIMLAGSLGAIGAGLGYVRFMNRTPRPPRKGRTSSPRLRVVRGGSEASEPSEPTDRPKWLN